MQPPFTSLLTSVRQTIFSNTSRLMLALVVSPPPTSVQAQGTQYLPILHTLAYRFSTTSLASLPLRLWRHRFGPSSHIYVISPHYGLIT